MPRARRSAQQLGAAPTIARSWGNDRARRDRTSTTRV
jgi:hypothetical protein